MRLRLQQIGGTLEIASGAGGTTLRAIVPLAGAAAAPLADAGYDYGP
jgi:signal transduction histidine kinase